MARRFGRRWLLVGAGAAALVGVSAVRVPAAPVTADPATLRARIRGTVPPYVGYAESTGRLGLPQIPQLESTVALLTGTTRIRAFVGSADAWRADELTPTGEHGVYRVGPSEFLWDFEANQLTRVLGIAAARLPRASDLLPPDLARRLLALAGSDPVAALPSRRIAGRDAAGLRVTPSDPQTTVGSVDIWADPATALPLRVEVAGRTGPPLLTTELLDVTDGPPDPAVLRPLAPPGAGDVTAEVVDVAGALKVLNAPPPPPSLVGRARVALPGTPLPGVGVYGTGLAAFVLVPTSRDIAERAVDSAAAAGGVAVKVPTGRAARVSTPLLSVAVRTRGRSGSLLLGAVDPAVLDRAIAELPRAAARMTVIETEGLTKRFRHVVAVDGVSLSVPTDARFGLLGPNGSGKTTLVRMLLGLVHPTAGRVALLGRPMPRDAAQVLPRVGALVEGPAAWPQLSGRTNLRLMDAAGGGGRRDRADRVEEALVRVGLGGIDSRLVRAYSLGMRQRLGIAAALLRKPELLLLDEPTNGLDPRGIGEMRALLRHFAAQGTTVVLSSHLLSEVEALCTRVGMMSAGRLVLTADLDTLRAPTGLVQVRTPDPAAAVGVLDGRVVHRNGDLLMVRADDPAALNARLVAAGVAVHELTALRRTLEQVVLELTGPSADRVDGPSGSRR